MSLRLCHRFVCLRYLRGSQAVISALEELALLHGQGQPAMQTSEEVSYLTATSLDVR